MERGIAATTAVQKAAIQTHIDERMPAALRGDAGGYTRFVAAARQPGLYRTVLNVRPPEDMGR